MKNFIKAVNKEFEIGPNAAHVAIIAYSTKAQTVLRFSDLSGSQVTADAVNRKVDALPHQRGYTFIDKALRLAERDVFTEANGMRRDVPKVVMDR